MRFSNNGTWEQPQGAVGVSQLNLEYAFFQVVPVPEHLLCGHKATQVRGRLTAELAYKDNFYLLRSQMCSVLIHFAWNVLFFVREASSGDVLAGLGMCCKGPAIDH